MKAPDGHADLLADTQDATAREAELEAELARLRAARRGRADVVLDESGTETPGAVAVPWPHQTLTFAGEDFQVRAPAPQAMAAIALSGSKHVKPHVQAGLASAFLARHLSEASYERLFERFTDPDDPEITDASIALFIQELFTVGTARPTGPSRR